MGQIVILTGDIGSGKTTVCRRFADRVSQQGMDCAGIVCPARFDGTDKIGIDLFNVRTREQWPLADADNLPGALRTGRYRFNTDTMDRGKACLDAACPCDVLIVDELGPLELERGQGWVNALDILRDGMFVLAVVVVRPHLVDTFSAALGNPSMTVLNLSSMQSGSDPQGALLSLLR